MPFLAAAAPAIAAISGAAGTAASIYGLANQPDPSSGNMLGGSNNAGGLPPAQGVQLGDLMGMLGQMQQQQQPQNLPPINYTGTF